MKSAQGGGQAAANVAEGHGLFPQTHDLVVLCGQAREGQFLERCELGNGLVSLRQAFLELGDLGLEPFDLRDPRVDDFSGLPQSTKAPLELFGEVLVGAGAGRAVTVLLRVERLFTIEGVVGV
ncbi:hypothetical protein ACFWOB_43715 [Streptomyces sp. NPDC058420]|uniref:hypothetical protein n=1 Tax=Streptomyces sp. NPDC058420 TaxID=3346489 RepID=UPI003658F224